MKAIKSVPSEYGLLDITERSHLENGFLRLSLPLSAYCEVNTIQAVQAFTAQNSGVVDANAPTGKGMPSQTSQNAAQGAPKNPGQNILELNVISREELSPMLRMMNLALSPGDVDRLVAEAGRGVHPLIASKIPGIGNQLPQDAGSNGGAAAPPTPGATNGQSNGEEVPNSPASTSPSAGAAVLLFDYDTLIQIYNAVAPLQAEFALDYMGFFNLLDPDEKEYISMSDLRHALCNLGDNLTDREFNHLMYTNGFLHRVTISVYEFMRYVMALEPRDCVSAVQQMNKQNEQAKSPAAASSSQLQHPEWQGMESSGVQPIPPGEGAAPEGGVPHQDVNGVPAPVAQEQQPQGAPQGVVSGEAAPAMAANGELSQIASSPLGNGAGDAMVPGLVAAEQQAVATA